MSTMESGFGDDESIVSAPVYEPEPEREAEPIREPEQEQDLLAGADNRSGVINDSWYGVPVEEVDPLVFEETFCVISHKYGKNYIFRFSTTKSLYLFAPLNPIRRFAVYLTTHRWFDLFMILLILLNCILLGLRTNHMNRRTGLRQEQSYEPYVKMIEYICLFIYIGEITLKVIAKGFICNRFSFMRNRWNILDFTVILIGAIIFYLEETGSSSTSELGDLEFVRALRIFRVIKTAAFLPGLKMMLNALFKSVISLLEVMALTFVCLVIFTLFSTKFFDGKLAQKCVIDKAGIADPNRLLHRPLEDEPDEDRDRLWTEWVSNPENWKRRAFPKDEPTQCGNASDTRQCGEFYTCIPFLGLNPDNGWTGFENFMQAMLSTFQLLSLDFWERLYDVVVGTSGMMSLVFFIFVIFLGAYYLLNLMLAVVAMSYETEVQSNDQAMMATPQKLNANRRKSNFSLDDLGALNICKMTNYRKRTKSEKERLVKRIKKVHAASELDQDKSADDIHFDDAIFSLLGLRVPGSRMSRTVTTNRSRYQLSEIERKIEEEEQAEKRLLESSVELHADSRETLRLRSNRCRFNLSKFMKNKLQPLVNHRIFEWTITGSIILNTLCLAVEHHGQTQIFKDILRIGNSVFMAVFTTECMLKLSALQGEYFQYGWNIFDMVIVFVSYLDIILMDAAGNNRGLSIMRSFRLLRVFKLAQSWMTMKILLNIIYASFSALGNLTLVLLLVIYVFAVMGMRIVGDHYTYGAFKAVYHPQNFPRWNWTNFWYAFMMVFRVLCGEWIEPLWACLDAQEYYIELHDSNAAYEYGKCFAIYLPILIIGNFIVLNLFLALLLNNFDTEELQSQKNKELEAAGRVENIKSIVEVLMTKKDNESEREESVTQADTAADENLANELYRMRNAATPTRKRSISRRRSIMRPHTLHKFEFSQSISSADRRSRLQASEGKKKFIEAVRKVIIQNRIAIARRVIERMAKHELRDKMTPEFFLTNPVVQMNSFAYDVTPESSLASIDLIVPGDCVPKIVSRCLKSNRINDTPIKHFTSKWYNVRLICLKIVTHPVFEYFVLLLIFGSSLTLCFEDVHLDSKPFLKSKLCYLNLTFTTMFCIEMVLKIMAIGFWGYFTGAWTLLDAFIVAVALVSGYFDLTSNACSAYPQTSTKSAAVKLEAVKALRTFRALRPLRAISRWQGMKIIVNSLVNAIPSIFNVLLVCLLFWLVFAIMGVQFFKGQFYRCIDEEGEKVSAMAVPNKHVCCAKTETHGYSWVNTESNYDNVFEGYLSLLQVATFEGWIELMTYSVDAVGVDKQPIADHQIQYYAFYVIFIIFGSFFTLQLFIGVIIDNFNVLKKKYEGNVLESLLTPLQRNYYTAMKNLGNKKPKRVIKRPSQAYRVVFYNLAMSRKLEVTILSTIFMDMSLETMEYVAQSQTYIHVTNSINVVFPSLYATEVLIKVFGLGPAYFSSPGNVYDFLLVIACAIDIWYRHSTIGMPVPPMMLRIVRVFRIGKILRLITAAQGIRKLLYALVVSLPALFNIGALLYLITFIYAILGMALFGKAPRNMAIDDIFNFNSFYNANLLLLRLMTAAGWNEILDSLTVVKPVCGSYRQIKCGFPDEPDCPNRGLVVAYIVSYLIITYLIITNLYIAIILENYVEGSNEEDVGIVEDDLDMFYNHWANYDPEATQFIDFYDIPNLLDGLDPPFQILKPNIVAIVAFNLPIARGNKVHCLDILQALIKQVLGPVDDSKEFRKLQNQMERKFQKQFATKALLDIVSSSRKWKVENNAALIIQRAWKEYHAKNKVRRKVDDSTQTRRSLLESTKSHGGIGHMMTRLHTVKTPAPSSTQTAAKKIATSPN